MPRGIYYRSPEMIAYLSERMKGLPRLKSFSEESKKRCSLAQLGNQKAKGCIRSDETKRKISDSTVGIPKPWLKGRKASLETRRKLSDAQKRVVAEGRNIFWKGGINKENLKIRASFEYKLWRESVFKRDNWTCVFCGKLGGKLQADHIKRFSDYPELRFDLDNGRTLCVPCHKTTDTYGGKKNKL